ncbi:hypothetical protein H109_03779 [Trichophyton interdigitale MR816]|uniref:Uncharacterized protein n=1 Tax=Trichophyton interdigitale (strain MR816) TaxID=1215338 RepID=A0A059J958_TRIIM|nr:hypothetical protein H109_03779 [Trichophyton interdigitale MR816]
MHAVRLATVEEHIPDLQRRDKRRKTAPKQSRLRVCAVEDGDPAGSPEIKEEKQRSAACSRYQVPNELLTSCSRVCRDDLKSPESSRASSPESSAATYAATALEKAFASFETVNSKLPTASEGLEQEDTRMGEDAEEEEQEFEFRLFSSVSTRKTADESRSTTKGHDGSGLGGVQKLRIRLRSPSPSARPLGDGGFLVPFRGWDYYFSNPELVMRAVGDTSWQRGAKDKNTSKQLDALRDTFKDTAVDGETILARAASVAWPGCHLPWRVVHIPGPKVKSVSSATPSTKSESSLSKKKKPGKKRRIALRKRVVIKKMAEETEKEKRNRKNRERKVKRRQKEREKKAAARAAAGEGEPLALAASETAATTAGEMADKS